MTKIERQCPSCGSTMIYARVKTKDWRCGRCGFLFKKPVEMEIIRVVKGRGKK